MDDGITYFVRGGGAGEPPPPNNPSSPPMRGIIPKPLFRTVEATDSTVCPMPPPVELVAPVTAPTNGTLWKTLCNTVDATECALLPLVVLATDVPLVVPTGLLGVASSFARHVTGLAVRIWAPVRAPGLVIRSLASIMECWLGEWPPEIATKVS